MTEPNAGLAIIHANRLETLRDLLVRWMRDNPLAPLEQEQILVQSNGIAQWLRMRWPNRLPPVAAALLPACS